MKKAVNLDTKNLSELAYDVVLHGDTSIAGRGERNLREIIVQTLARIPQKAYEKLIRERGLIFVGCGPKQLGEAFQLFFPVPDGQQEIRQDIVLLSSELCGQPLSKAMNAVAHELAHVFLGHDDDRIGKGKNIEAEADRLAVRWGFKPSYPHGRRAPS
jgi:hypothetical protein